MEKPEISVILPVYNSDKFLKEALNSVLEQTFKNWELVAINDGSTDRSLQILEQYQKSDARIRIISRENRGLVKTLNEGVNLARGEWIARMDADDVCLPDRFSKQLAWAKTQNADLCGGWIQRIGIEGCQSWEFPESNEGIYAWLLFRSAFAHPTIIINKKIAMHFLYDESFLHSQDYELWTRLALHNIVMTNLPEIVLQYRIHEKQISQAKKDLQTDLRMKITSNYWQKSPLCRNIEFQPCLTDERIEIDRPKFISAIKSLETIESRLSDRQAIAAVNHHRIWFIYRSIHLGHETILPHLKSLRLSKAKRLAVGLLSIARAGFIINYFRHANWVRHLPLRWLF